MFSKLADRCAWWLSRRELRSHMRAASLAEIVTATQTFQGHGVYRHINALHDPAETLRLAEMVRQRSPKRILEIGTCWGGTLFVWCRSNPQAELIISVDLPGGEFGGGYAVEREKLYREFAHGRDKLRLELLRLDSHAQSSRARVARLLDDKPIDFLFIDGDHTYDGVRKDFEMYAPLVAPGGLIALHDINTRGNGHHVARFWHEIRGQHVSGEIVADPSREEYGIGLVFVDSQPREAAREAVCESHG